MPSVSDLLHGQMPLFEQLPVQHAPDPAAAYAATLGPDTDPRRKFAVIKEAACRRLLPPVLDWLAESDADETARAEVLASLIQAADPDGYDFARNLERLSYWDGLDSEMVEILDTYDGIRHDIVAQMVRAWVAANGITLDLEVGARVRDLQRRCVASLTATSADLPLRIGTVVALRPETAEVVVQFDEERHRFAGSDGGTILPRTRVQRLDS